ncbi:hypothetical protein DFH08DRAFT_976168 [Mycena albidolilacea]|uniref:Uncharacterized protein n=1 Tax=Mycena albidolilacea TaxID=1033008 RepID=A0AAD7EAJ4_9AGAR|nr:hypothetical protein DFH08DRAFT_976168 [Mycena albidolilacea]
MTPALGGLPALCVLHFKRAELSSTNHLKLSSHIVTDSRENKRKALHDFDSSSDSDLDLATNKRLRSASVEPPPQPLTLDASSSSNEPPAPPVNPAPKTIPKSLHFAKNAMANDTGSNTNRYQAIQGVTQLTNGQQHTTPPEGGFPAIHLLESPLRNTTDHNRNAWAAITGPKGWVRTFRPKYDPNPRDVVQKLKYVIPRIVDASNVIISPPTARENLTERSPAPWHFLISSLPKASLKKLTDEGFWSTPTITFIVIPYDTPLPKYIMTLQNFTIFDHEEGIKFIRATVLTKLKAISGAIDALAVNAGIDATTAEACLDTIVVKPLDIALAGGKTDTVWNIYFTVPPTLSLSHYRMWTQAARGIKYETDNFGTGVARKGEAQFRCGGCGSYDHPVGLCWAPRLVGWFGEQPKSTTSDDATLFDADEKTERNAGPSGSKHGPKKGKSGDGRITKKGGKAQRRR